MLESFKQRNLIPEKFQNSFDVIKETLNQNPDTLTRKVNQFFPPADFQANSNAQTLEENVISEIPPEGYIINTPGEYVFANNIDWQPNAGILTAITINSSDVTLDLKGYTLRCINSPTSPLPTGIHISQNTTNTQVTNGKIINMGLYGIYCEQSSAIQIDHITIAGLKNFNSLVAPYGIYILGCTDVTISHITIRDIDTESLSLSGIQITETTNSKISHCKFKNMINRSGACVGIGYFACADIDTKDMHFNGLQTYGIPNPEAAGHTCIAVVVILSLNMVYENFRIKNIKGSCDDAHGISIFVSFINIIIKNCTVNNVSTGQIGGTSAKSTGIEILGAIDVEVVDCKATHITAINPGDKQCAGFSNGLSAFVNFTRCSARYINCYNDNLTQDAETGFGFGFGWAPDPRALFIGPAFDAKYLNCRAVYSQVGFDTWYHKNSIWENSTANYNGINVMNLNCSERTLLCDPCSECDPPMSVTLTNIASNNEILKNKKIRYKSNYLC